MSKARMGLMGAVGGLIIVGVAFIVPRIIGETVVEPVGGNIGGTEAGQNCDDVLRNQFAFQRNASTTVDLNAVIARIQNQRVEQCSVDVWSPSVVDAKVVAAGPPDAGDNGCIVQKSGRRNPRVRAGKHGLEAIGGQDVPSGLHEKAHGDVRKASGRDRENNIIVHWSRDPAKRPTDNAKCWLYVARLSTWSVENY